MELTQFDQFTFLLFVLTLFARLLILNFEKKICTASNKSRDLIGFSKPTGSLLNFDNFTPDFDWVYIVW